MVRLLIRLLVVRVGARYVLVRLEEVDRGLGLELASCGCIGEVYGCAELIGGQWIIPVIGIQLIVLTASC